jgi:hypothetical protein
VGSLYTVKISWGVLMAYASPRQLGCPPVAGQTLRADCEGRAWSAACCTLLLRGGAHATGTRADAEPNGARTQRYPGGIGPRIIRAMVAGVRKPHPLAALRHDRCQKAVEEIALALPGTWREAPLCV